LCRKKKAGGNEEEKLSRLNIMDPWDAPRKKKRWSRGHHRWLSEGERKYNRVETVSENHFRRYENVLGGKGDRLLSHD